MLTLKHLEPCRQYLAWYMGGHGSVLKVNEGRRVDGEDGPRGFGLARDEHPSAGRDRGRVLVLLLRPTLLGLTRRPRDRRWAMRK